MMDDDIAKCVEKAAGRMIDMATHITPESIERLVEHHEQKITNMCKGMDYDPVEYIEFYRRLIQDAYR